jgi:general secretion pathway protein D
VHDEIQDLLTQLRKLNDVQIVVEVRFITLRDNFFERVGIDFDFKINDNSGLTAAQVNTTDKFNPSVIVGRDPTIDRFVPTADLDVGFNQGSLGGVLPTFGGFDAGTAANFGFAILSDIEVFFLITASKGDTRTNLSTAPTVTMFNGQSASVSDFSARPFVTSVIPIVGDFAVAQQPVVSLIPDGTTLNVRATASDDRRFISLALNPYFTKITDVKTFTFDGSRPTRQTSASFLQDLLNQANPNNQNKVKGPDVETVTQGVTVQQPVVSVTTVNTVVSIPDGGTVLIGGVKELREARLEKGVPFLSNLPYVNRLFKNVGIGRETANLMMMVTPRIIIQEEEERRQVGPVGGGN